jgi:hypothetical protein
MHAMAELPFLVVHGALAWKILAAATAAGALAGPLWLRRRAERRRAAADLAELSAGVSAPTDGPAAVRGVLRGGSAQTLAVAFATRADRLHHDRSDGLWLDCDGERVDLIGPVRVLRGSCGQASRGLPRALPEAIRAQEPDPGQAARLAIIADGDVVIARGRLARRASAAEVNDYRAPAGGWVLEPDELLAIEAIAERVAAPAVPLARASAILLLALGAGLAIIAMHGAGRLAVSRARSVDHEARAPRVPLELHALDAVALAAAMPGTRADALGLLDDRLRRRTESTEETLELRRRLAGLLGCREEASELQRQGRYADMLATADGCGDAGQAAQALLWLGRYGEATARASASGSDLGLRDQGAAAIGAGRWADAARIAADLRAALADRRRPTYLTEEQAKAIVARVDCSEQLFRLRAGEAPAAGKLHAMAGRDPFCKLFDAISSPLDRQSSALAGTPIGEDATLEFAVQALEWAAGGHATEVQPGTDLFDAISLRVVPQRLARNALLAPLALATSTDPPGTEGHVRTHTWMAAHEYLRGDLARARSEALLAGGGDHEAGYPRQHAASFLVSLALRTGAPLPYPVDSPPSLHPSLQDLVRLRQGMPSREGGLGGPSRHCEERADRAMQAAFAGDGAPLADLVRACMPMQRIETIVAVLPLVQRGRARLAAAFRALDDDSLALVMADDVPFGAISTFALRRDLARLAGDDAGAAGWQAIIDRHMAALADRQRLTAMIVWRLL